MTKGIALLLLGLALTGAGPALRGCGGASSEDENIRRLYARLRPTDFSARVLAARSTNLAVLPVSGVRWDDLGEPHRCRPGPEEPHH